MRPGLALARMMALLAAVSVVTAGRLPTFPPNTVQLQALAARLHQQRARQQLELRSRVSAAELELRLLSSGRVAQLQHLVGRQLVYYVTDNLNAARTVGTDRLWPAGELGLALTGAGVTVAIWDGGMVLASHQEFGDRLTQMDFTFPETDHATHVAGIIAATGVDTAARGMAGGVQIISYDWEDDAAEMAAAAAEGLVLSNHSYSIAAGWERDWRGDTLWAWLGDPLIDPNEDWKFGFYMQESADWDQIAAAAPDCIIITSAGNDRDDDGPGLAEHWVWNGAGWVLVAAEREPDGDYDSLPGGAGSAKNVLVVGAVEDIPGGYQGSADVQMATFSSWGPTDDGRIKPDLVANGTTLYSSLATSDDAYGLLSGTSMAAPVVTGSLALLQEHYRATHGDAQPRSATLRALVVHTADEAGDAPGPDYRFGWGLLNTATAAEVISLDTLDNHRLQELVLVDGGEVTFTISADGLTPLKATIAWTDPPGPVLMAAVDPLDLMLVNDLDITLTSMVTGQVEYPWVLDDANPTQAAETGVNDRDNIEQVLVTAPSAGDYLITIDHKSILTNGSQQFSLIITGATFPSRPRVLVWDGDSTAADYSGRFIRDLLQAGDSIQVDYRTVLPTDLSGYDAAFLSFGNSGAGWENTPFTGDLAAVVQAYLAGGGRLYLEGGDALARVGLDAEGKDSLWNMLGIDSVADGRLNPLDSLVGQVGALTEGLLFTSSIQADPQYIDLYFPATGLAAFEESGYGVVAVQQANENENGSRSFVFSYALAALVDGTWPSTREELLRRIYDFLLEEEPIPMITAVSPGAIWRGRRTLVNLYGENLAEVTTVTVDQPAEVENPPDTSAWGDQLSVYLTIAEETTADSVTITAQAPAGSAAIAVRLDHAPQAVDDTAATPEDSTLVLAVLSNDRHPPGDSLRISAVSLPAQGSVTWQSGDTTISYSPETDYFGPDSFTYTAVDTGGDTTRATVRLTVLPVNDPPGPFMLLAPVSGFPIEINSDNIDDSLWFTWESAPDVEGDIIQYSLWVTPALAEVLAVELGSDTSFIRPYRDLAAAALATGERGLLGSWTIRASDGDLSVDARKGPFVLILDAATLAIQLQAALPKDFALEQNYPNPFNPATTIPFALPEAAAVSLAVYDLRGREIRRLVQDRLPAGYHRIIWDGCDATGRVLPSGIYLVIMKAPGIIRRMKALLLR